MMAIFLRRLFPVVTAGFIGATAGFGEIGRLALAQPVSATVATPKSLHGKNYRPAVLRLTYKSERGTGDDGAELGFLDLILIPPEGDVVGRRVAVTSPEFVGLLKQLYGQLSRQESLNVTDQDSPARQLFRLLVEPVNNELQAAAITTLLISADPGLQAIPFAALHDGRMFFGERYALSLTPSLGLMPLDLPASPQTGEFVAAGASRFEGLSPLPLVPQEMNQVTAASTQYPATKFLNEAFTPQLLLNKAADPAVQHVHVATHAEFLPGGPSKARLYTGSRFLSLNEFASLRQRREGAPLQLFVLSACRTALGDRDSELGFAGLALQAGSRSAIGSIWYVDDVATSAFFVQFYRYLDAGLPKAEAIQLVRQAMANNRFVVRGNSLYGPDDKPVLQDLSSEQRHRIGQGFRHPFFWAGITLLGTPW
jgi:CHAT domain-containing protein